ncbi:MAG: hypothetical protein ACT4QF_14550 [Sporichthyaceae bacterium]
MSTARRRKPLRGRPRRTGRALAGAMALLFACASSAGASAGFFDAVSPLAGNLPTTLTLGVPYDGSVMGNVGRPTQIRVRLPAGWHSAECGGTRVASPSGQVVEELSQWTCSNAGSMGGAQVLLWSGQGLPLTVPDFSKQQVSFAVTAPAADDTGAWGTQGSTNIEGFWVETSYTRLEHSDVWAWKSPNSPASWSGEVSEDLVLAVGPGPIDPPPVGVCAERAGQAPQQSWRFPDAQGRAFQCLGVVVPPLGPGEFAWSVVGNTPVTLSQGELQGAYRQFVGILHPVVVSDTRQGGPDWSVSGQVGEVSTGLTAAGFGWAPVIAQAGAGAVAGPVVASGYPTGTGLSEVSLLASAPNGHPRGSATIRANLDVRMPADIDPGTYVAVLTLTALS